MTNDDLTMMCRQLEPTSQGIPIQIYAFSKDKEWTKYEALTSDIFDHLLSSVKYFKLECFELTQYISKLVFLNFQFYWLIFQLNLLTLGQVVDTSP